MWLAVTRSATRPGSAAPVAAASVSDGRLMDCSSSNYRLALNFKCRRATACAVLRSRMFTRTHSAILCLCIFAGFNTAHAEDLLFDCTYRDGSHVKWTIGNNMIKSDDKEVKSTNIV